MVQWRCGAKADQAFQIDASGGSTRIANASLTQCMGSSPTSSAGGIQWSTCQGSSTQQWTQRRRARRGFAHAP